MPRTPDYSLHSKKAYGLFIPTFFIVLAVLFIISWRFWPLPVTVIIGLIALNALLGLFFGARMTAAKCLAAELIGDALHEKTGGRILDLGAGTGFLTVRLARRGFHMTGVDPDADALQKARRNAGIEGLEIDFQEGDGAALKQEPETFDAVTGLNLLHEADDPAAVLGESARILKPDGILAMADMRRGPAAFSIFWFGFFKFFSRADLRGLLEEAGFTNVGIRRASIFHNVIEARKKKE